MEKLEEKKLQSAHLKRQIDLSGIEILTCQAALNDTKNIYEVLIEEQFKGKEKLIEPNVKALRLGFNYAE